jgi:dienelactone hydrolase
VDTIILLTDIYGPDYINTQLVADEWAKAGFRVVVPDLFVGDPVPIEHIRVSSSPLL